MMIIAVGIREFVAEHQWRADGGWKDCLSNETEAAFQLVAESLSAPRVSRSRPLATDITSSFDNLHRSLYLRSRRDICCIAASPEPLNYEPCSLARGLSAQPLVRQRTSKFKLSMTSSSVSFPSPSSSEHSILPAQ
jgi:hypothetical protein